MKDVQSRDRDRKDRHRDGRSWEKSPSSPDRERYRHRSRLRYRPLSPSLPSEPPGGPHPPHPRSGRPHSGSHPCPSGLPARRARKKPRDNNLSLCDVAGTGNSPPTDINAVPAKRRPSRSPSANRNWSPPVAAVGKPSNRRKKKSRRNYSPKDYWGGGPVPPPSPRRRLMRPDLPPLDTSPLPSTLSNRRQRARRRGSPDRWDPNEDRPGSDLSAIPSNGDHPGSVSRVSARSRSHSCSVTRSPSGTRYGDQDFDRPSLLRDRSRSSLSKSPHFHRRATSPTTNRRDGHPREGRIHKPEPCESGSRVRRPSPVPPFRESRSRAKGKRRRRRGGVEAFDPGTGANSIEVNMSGRRGIVNRGDFSRPPPAGPSHHTKSGFDLRYSRSPTPNQSFHGSPIYSDRRDGSGHHQFSSQG